MRRVERVAFPGVNDSLFPTTLRGRLSRCLREILPPIVDLRVSPELLEEGLNSLLTQRLHQLGSLRSLLRLPRSAVCVSTAIDAQHDDTFIRPDRTAHCTDR